jgi:manganese/zinc/iron transport system permease protein
VKHLNLPLDHVHAPAERMEHFIGGKITEQLAADVGSSQLDPHGRNIPAASE